MITLEKTQSKINVWSNGNIIAQFTTSAKVKPYGENGILIQDEMDKFIFDYADLDKANCNPIVTASNPNDFVIETITSFFPNASAGGGTGGGGGTWGSILGTLSNQTDLQNALNAKQATLVSGTNIKTINDVSLVGSGNLSVITTEDEMLIDNSTRKVITGANLDASLNAVDTALVNARSTGIKSGGALTSLGSGIVRIASGNGEILNNTTPSNPTYTSVSWNQTDIDLSSLGTGLAYVYVNSSGVVTFTTTAPTSTDRRLNIYLHRVSIIGGLFSASGSIANPVQQYGQGIADVFEALGVVKSGLAVSPNGANLSINASSGTIYQSGVNFQVSALNPNKTDYTAKTPVTFRLFTQNNTQGGDRTTLDVTNYDLNGVVTAIPGSTSRAQIWTVFQFPTEPGEIRIAYGQKFFASISAAQVDLANGLYTPIIPSQKASAIILGYIITAVNATNLSDGVQVFVNTNRFGLLGGAISTSGLGCLLAVNNLSDLTSLATAQNNIGLIPNESVASVTDIDFTKNQFFYNTDGTATAEIFTFSFASTPKVGATFIALKNNTATNPIPVSGIQEQVGEWKANTDQTFIFTYLGANEVFLNIIDQIDLDAILGLAPQGNSGTVQQRFENIGGSNYMPIAFQTGVNYDNTIGGAGGQGSTQALTVGTIVLSPFSFDGIEDLSFTRMGTLINTAGTNGTGVARVLVYDTNADGTPNQLVKQVTVTGLNSSSGLKDAALVDVMERGKRYWVGIHTDSDAIVRSVNVACMSQLGRQSSTGTGYYKRIVRTLAYASGTPTTWVWNVAELDANNVPIISWLAA